jgi:hypothetical protein
MAEEGLEKLFLSEKHTKEKLYLKLQGFLMGATISNL